MNETSNGSPFHAIYIIDANSGLSLVSSDFSDRHLDEDLVSGMFRALETFINHLAYSNSFELIQDINFQGTRIIYERCGAVNPVLGVAISRMKEPVQSEHLLLKLVLDEFYETFEQKLSNFRGNVAPFQSFRARVAEMILMSGGIFTKKVKLIAPQYIQSPIQSTIQSPRFPTFHGFQTIDE